jgi:hypothetical protein
VKLEHVLRGINGRAPRRLPPLSLLSQRNHMNCFILIVKINYPFGGHGTAENQHCLCFGGPEVVHPPKENAI